MDKATRIVLGLVAFLVPIVGPPLAVFCKDTLASPHFWLNVAMSLCPAVGIGIMSPVTLVLAAVVHLLAFFHAIWRLCSE